MPARSKVARINERQLKDFPQPPRPTLTDAAVEQVHVTCYTIPTDFPESDGTYTWDKTTMVLVEATSQGKQGLGYTYADTSTAQLISGHLARIIRGRNALDVEACWHAMRSSVRNLGRPGIAAMAISAIDISLWDLKAKLLGVSLSTLLGAVREEVPIYGSGGFTSYSIEQLQAQLGGWAETGISMVKMKIGRHPEQDLERARAAREAIGPHVRLFVDANGAYGRKQALLFADHFRELGVTWFEEPVTADDLEGLHLLRNRAPAEMDIAAGEYNYGPLDFRRMFEAKAVDVMQADATRCGGITGFLQAATLCLARSMPLSAHTAPAIHAHLGCAVQPLRHLEYFHDHVRIEEMFFEGVLQPQKGMLRPDRQRPGLGLIPRRAVMAKYQVD
jgi:L-alanine-DL-glutamate epimerase-like enolase superfamily enzyme